MNIRLPIKTSFEAELKRNSSIKSLIPVGTWWDFEHWRNGKIIDRWGQKNVTINEGLTKMLNVMFHGATVINPWYIGLFEDNYTPLITNTYAVPGFTESIAYDEVGRVEFVDAEATAKIITNSASKSIFTINATKTMYGAFLCGGGTEDTGPIASFADYGGTVTGTVLATDVAHGRSTGDVVAITDTANYNGTYAITKVSDDTFYFTATWVATETGNWTNKPSKKKTDVAGGGTLFASSLFSVAKSVVDNDSLAVSCTITLADV